MLAIFQAYGTSPARNDLFRNKEKGKMISIAHSFNTQGGRWSGPGGPDFSEGERPRLYFKR